MVMTFVAEEHPAVQRMQSSCHQPRAPCSLGRFHARTFL